MNRKEYLGGFFCKFMVESDSTSVHHGKLGVTIGFFSWTEHVALMPDVVVVQGNISAKYICIGTS